MTDLMELKATIDEITCGKIMAAKINTMEEAIAKTRLKWQIIRNNPEEYGDYIHTWCGLCSFVNAKYNRHPLSFDTYCCKKCPLYHGDIRHLYGKDDTEILKNQFDCGHGVNGLVEVVEKFNQFRKELVPLKSLISVIDGWIVRMNNDLRKAGF